MLGQRIYQTRTSLGWNQVELARKLGVAKQTVSNWENENIQPSVEMLVRISKLLGVTTDYLLGLDNTPRIDIDGLPENVIAHLILLIEDYRTR